jgi:hypothetical protein
MNLYLYTHSRVDLYFRNNCLDLHMYIQRREMYDWGWRPPNGWHLIPFGLLLFLYIYISIPAFNWCWACWILLSPDGSHFKQQDQDGRPASSMKEWQLNRSAYTRGHTTADADGQHIGSWTRPAAAAVIQWLCRVFICFLLLFLFFLCVSFLISLLLMVQPRRNRKQKLSEENKSMAIYSLQHRLHLSVPPLLGCRLSYVRGCVYTRGPVAVKKVCRMCVYTLFFFFFVPAELLDAARAALALLLFSFCFGRNSVYFHCLLCRQLPVLREMLSAALRCCLAVWLRLNHRDQSKNEVQHNTFWESLLKIYNEKNKF